MSTILAYPVALPLVGAAFVAFTDDWTPKRFKDIPTILFVLASTVMSFVILVRSDHMTLVQWFGGWKPRNGLALGVGFVADPLGAGMAALAGVLIVVSLLFTWQFMQDAPRLYRVLMLVFLAGISGFALSGDLFNMFVWFEVMGVSAYALAGYMVEDLGPTQGALNFAITNTVAALFILFGTALLYGGTGALNLAQIGHVLHGRSANGLTIVAFTLVVAGLLVKSAAIPFHLWLADAYAVAPAPVCAVFAGAMSEVGLFGIARIYSTVFAGSFGDHSTAVRDVLLAFGIATALLGGVMALLQRHFKRLLAYAVISHVGLTLCGVALFSKKALAGAVNLALSPGFLISGFFFAAGLLVREFRTVDELELRGRGRRLPLLGVTLGAAALALAGLPYTGSYVGHSLLDDAAKVQGLGWISPFLMIATALSVGAILRAVARIFLGWGPRDDPLLVREPPDEPPEEQTHRWLMLSVTTVVVLIGIGFGFTPGLSLRTEQAAHRFQDRTAYGERVLDRKVRTYPSSPSLALPRATSSSIAYGLGGTVLALAVGAFGLWRRKAPRALRAAGTRYLDPVADGLKAAHTGVIGDYVMWITVGTALLGGLWALTLH